MFINSVRAKKITASLLAAAMLFTLSTGCGKAAENAVTAETALSSSTEAETEEVETNAVLFDENYDPLSENYNPYADNSAQAKAVTLAAKTSKTQSTTTASATSSSTKSTAEISLNLNTSNSWESGSDKFIQLDAVIKNNGKDTVNGWTVVIEAGKSASVEQSWNCDLSIKSGKITAKPVDFNSEITAGGEASFGIILKNASVNTAKSSVKAGKITSAASGSQASQNNNNSQSGSVGNNNPVITAAKDVPKPTTDDWLSVKGTKIVDKNGRQVWLTGINWFGYNTGTNTFDGLWTCDLNTSLASIADHGFNLLRVPISTQLIKQWSNGEYPTANFNQATNSYLVGMNSLEIFDYVVGQCRANGIKIMIDIHCAETDSMGHMKNMWYNGSISEKDYLDTLKWISNRYKNDDTIIAYDLENEPHGKANESPRAKWDNSKNSDNWKYIAEKAANSVLSANPNVLVMVEGIEIYPKNIKTNGSFSSANMGDYYCNWWGGNLRGVRDNPINLGKYQNKLVYSPHDYGPSVYQQPWFKGNYTYDSLYRDCWYDNWFYIQKEGIAPLLIGEWGGYMTEPNLTWMTDLRKLIKTNKINHTFWCFNANSGDTGGLVKDDFTTWDTEKYNFVKEVLWQQNGKFVGLDHKIPLGKNGITLSAVKK